MWKIVFSSISCIIEMSVYPVSMNKLVWTIVFNEIASVIIENIVSVL